MKKQIQVIDHSSKPSLQEQSLTAPPPMEAEQAKSVSESKTQRRPSAGTRRLEEAIWNVCALLEMQNALILANSEANADSLLTNPLPLSPSAAVGLNNLVGDASKELVQAFKGEPKRAGGDL